MIHASYSVIGVRDFPAALMRRQIHFALIFRSVSIRAQLFP
jgi:hypothetical protein